jgi:rhamnulokinase
MSRLARFVAADLGASSGRVIAGVFDGERITLEELNRFPNVPLHQNGELHWDLPTLWFELQRGFRQFVDRFGSAPDAIGIDAWGVDFALVDEKGALLQNPFHYRDTRTDGLPDRFFQLVAESDVFAETGTQTMQINTLFQLYAMSGGDAEQFAPSTSLLMIPDLFQFLLCGQKRIEFTEASTTQFYSLKSRKWSERLLREAGIPKTLLPPVVMPGTVLGRTLPNLATQFRFDRDVPVVAVATHDTASAVAAIPDMAEDSVFLSSGTWSLLGVELAEPNTSEGVRLGNFTNEGSASGDVLLLRNVPGLWFLQECRNHWLLGGKELSWSELVDAAASAPPLRSIIDPNARGLQVQHDMPAAIQDLCRKTSQPVPQTAGEIARCVFESLSLAYRSALESLKTVIGRELRTLHVVGGGAQNALLAQMTADACNLKVITGPVEASALGNVMLQAIATGHIKDIAAGRSIIGRSIERTIYHSHPSEFINKAYATFERMKLADG